MLHSDITCAQLKERARNYGPLRIVQRNNLALAPAVAMDLVHQGGHRLGRRKAIDSVPQVEHMPALAHRAEIVDDAARFSADGGLAAEKRHRVDIALQGDLILCAAPGLGQVDRPVQAHGIGATAGDVFEPLPATLDRKSTRLNSSHVKISYAVFCLKKKKPLPF